MYRDQYSKEPPHSEGYEPQQAFQVFGSKDWDDRSALIQ